MVICSLEGRDTSSEETFQLLIQDVVSALILNQRESWYAQGPVFQSLFGGSLKSKKFSVKQENTTFPRSFRGFAKLIPYLHSLISKNKIKWNNFSFLLQKSTLLILRLGDVIAFWCLVFLFVCLIVSFSGWPGFHFYLIPQVNQSLPDSFVGLLREKFCQNLIIWMLSRSSKDEFSMEALSGSFGNSWEKLI